MYYVYNTNHNLSSHVVHISLSGKAPQLKHFTIYRWKWLLMHSHIVSVSSCCSCYFSLFESVWPSSPTSLAEIQPIHLCKVEVDPGSHRQSSPPHSGPSPRHSHHSSPSRRNSPTQSNNITARHHDGWVSPLHKENEGEGRCLMVYFTL